MKKEKVNPIIMTDINTGRKSEIILRTEKLENDVPDEESLKTAMRKIEFNNGFVTSLALFYGHLERNWSSEDKRDFSIYGASDHLYDIQYPKGLDKKLKGKIEKFRDDVFKVRLEHITKEDADKLFERCKKLLMEIDRKQFKLKRVVAYYG